MEQEKAKKAKALIERIEFLEREIENIRSNHPIDADTVLEVHYKDSPKSVFLQIDIKKSDIGAIMGVILNKLAWLSESAKKELEKL